MSDTGTPIDSLNPIPVEGYEVASVVVTFRPAGPGTTAATYKATMGLLTEQAATKAIEQIVPDVLEQAAEAGAEAAVESVGIETAARIAADNTLPDATGWMVRPAVQDLRDRERLVTNYGVVAGGSDITAALSVALSNGGDWYIPEGDYRIARAGSNAGGVLITLAKSLRVRVHPRARIWTDDLDADAILIQPVANGVGLDARGIDVEWSGGIIDISGSRISTTVPFVDVYPAPPGKQGDSNTTDGLSIRLGYTDLLGASRSAGRNVRIERVDFYAGDHWDIAGGDSLLFIGGGAGRASIRGCRFTGARDLGVYLSGAGRGANGNTIDDCEFNACFGGASSKRTGSKFNLLNSRFSNCITAAALSPLDGPSIRAVITGNHYDSCSVFFRLSSASDCVLAANDHASIGAYRSDGVTPVSPYGVRGYWLDGAQRNTLRDLACTLVNTGHTDARMVYLEAASVNLTSDDNDISGALVSGGFLYCVEVVADGGERNRISRCYNTGAAVVNPLPGPTDYVVRYNPVNGGDIQRSTLRIADGSVTSPVVARDAQSNTGLYFDTHKVAMTTNGIDVAAAEELMFRLRRPLHFGSYSKVSRDNLAPSGPWSIFNSDVTEPQVYLNASAGWRSMVRLPARPRVIAGITYTLYDGPIGSTASAGAADTLMMYPFRVDDPYSFATLNLRLVLGVAGAAAKFAIWPGSAGGVGGRPTGVPLYSSNAETDCSASNITRNVAMAGAFATPGWHWIGHVLKASPPIFAHIPIDSAYVAARVGSVVIGASLVNPVMALSMALPFATNIATVDLTGVSWSYLAGVGVPVFSLSVS